MSSEHLSIRNAAAGQILGELKTADADFSNLGLRASQMEEGEKELSEGVMGLVEPNKKPGEVIAKLASSRMFISQEASVYTLAAGMEKNPGTFAVGVVNNNGKPIGIVLRRELFDNLGRMYGRDLYKRKLVPELMKTPQLIRDDTSIFSVADNLAE